MVSSADELSGDLTETVSASGNNDSIADSQWVDGLLLDEVPRLVPDHREDRRVASVGKRNVIDKASDRRRRSAELQGLDGDLVGRDPFIPGCVDGEPCTGEQRSHGNRLIAPKRHHSLGLIRVPRDNAHLAAAVGTHDDHEVPITVQGQVVTVTDPR